MQRVSWIPVEGRFGRQRIERRRTLPPFEPERGRIRPPIGFARQGFNLWQAQTWEWHGHPVSRICRIPVRVLGVKENDCGQLR